MLADESDQNQGTKRPSAHTSSEQLKEPAKAAPTADEVIIWMRAQRINEYNRKLLVTRGGKPCGKTPQALWAELLSATEKLPAKRLAAYAGHIHRVKFTKAGLAVQHQGERHTYFPDVSTKKAREQALKIFNELKIRSPEGSKRTVYVLNYEEGAYVWSKPWEEEGRYMGFWPLQQRVSMLETLSERTSEHFRKMRALQRAQRKQTQAAAQAARTQAARAWQPYEKNSLQQQGIKIYRKKHYRKMIHALTGETHWIPKNSENNRKNEK